MPLLFPKVLSANENTRNLFRDNFFQVTGINPQQVFSSLGDSLQGLAQAVQNASPGAAAADTIRQGYREFSSLLFR